MAMFAIRLRARARYRLSCTLCGNAAKVALPVWGVLPAAPACADHSWADLWSAGADRFNG